MLEDANQSRSLIKALTYLDLDATTEQYLAVLSTFTFGVNNLPQELWDTEDECSEGASTSLSHKDLVVPMNVLLGYAPQPCGSKHIEQPTR